MTEAGPSSTRESLMRELLHHKVEGLTLDELGVRLGITRTAVQQHVTALERDGFVTAIGRRSTGGRPSRAYGLTEAGREVFPRQYDLLALGMLESVRKELGDEAVEGLLRRMADSMAAERVASLDVLSASERLEAVVEIMNQLGYDASMDPDGRGISAKNCVYHKLASKTRAVCRFDTRLLSNLLGEDVELTHCMADGERTCTFREGMKR